MVLFVLLMIAVLLFFILKAVSVAKAPPKDEVGLTPGQQKAAAILQLVFGGLMVVVILYMIGVMMGLPIY
ncbi:hypothetical protein [Brevundimonas sp.]|uniref:hypothetical protein n=1 Tax=Brevundimonas sp. TaxID=1871086 RepID=UPI0035B1BACB